MFEKSSEELALNKLYILYILNKMQLPLTNGQITNIFIENEISFILMYEVGIVQRCQENVDKRFFLNELLQQLRLPTTV